MNLQGRKLRVFTTADGLPSNAITSVAGGAGDSVWVGTNGGGAFRFDKGRVVERLGAEVVGATLRTIEVDRAASCGSAATAWSATRMGPCATSAGPRGCAATRCASSTRFPSARGWARTAAACRASSPTVAS